MQYKHSQVDDKGPEKIYSAVQNHLMDAGSEINTDRVNDLSPRGVFPLNPYGERNG
jgi:hypothetical protein